MFEDGYIIECEPLRTDVNDISSVIEHLNSGFTDGLTYEEIKSILDWTVENTRKNIEHYIGMDIDNVSLFGLCGFAQSSTLIPLEKYFKVTYNNTVDFPFVEDDIKHAFGTVLFPLKTDDGIVFKRYLVDVTFRQFFTKLMCSEPQYKLDINNNLIYYAHPGYFLCDDKFKTVESISFCSQLLKKGYVEFDDDKLRLYINSFIYSSVCYNNPLEVGNIKNIPIEIFKDRLNKFRPIEIEFDEERLIKNNCNIDFGFNRCR